MIVNPYRFAAAGGGGEYFLDTYGATCVFAVSLRQLSPDFSSVVRGLRSTDSATRDFTEADITDAGNWSQGGDVSLDSWYDQSGGGRHATGVQKIASSGSLVTLSNNKPSVLVTTGDPRIVLTTLDIPGPATVVTVTHYNTADITANTAVVQFTTSGGIFHYTTPATRTVATGGIGHSHRIPNTNKDMLLGARFTVGGINGYWRFEAYTQQGDAGVITYGNSSSLILLGRTAVANAVGIHRVSEVIIFNSDMTDQMPAILANMMSYWDLTSDI